MSWSFVEREFQTYIVDVRLFIEGVEVTTWLQDDISWTIAGTGGVNNLSFTLANPEDIWIVTPDNLENKWRTGLGLYSELEKKFLYERKSAREAEARAVMEKYNTHDQLRSAGLYGMGPHSLIFHKNDAVRLFVRHPLVVQDWWLCAFTGFISQKPLSEDYMVGSGPITFSAYDLKGIMQKMRVQENPMPTSDTTGGGSALKDALDKSGYLGSAAGPFEELLLAGGNHPLAGRDFERSMDLLFFGKEGVKQSGVSTARIKIFGGTVTTTGQVPANRMQPQNSAPPVNSEEEAAFLEIAKINTMPVVQRCGGLDTDGNWNDLEKRASVYATASTEDRATLDRVSSQSALLSHRINDIRVRAEVEARVKKANGQADPSTQQKGYTAQSNRTAMLRGHVGRFVKGEIYYYPGDDLEEWHNLCLLGNKAGFYMSFDQVTDLGNATVLENVEASPWNGYVHMLLPKGGLPVKDFVQTTNTVNDFVASGVAFTDRYQLVNLICEQLEYQWYVTPVGDVAFEFPMFDFDTTVWKSYAAVHKIDKHATSSAIEDEAEEIPTVLVVTAQERSAAAPDTSGLGVAGDPNRVVAYAPLLATRLGVVVEQIQAPPSVGGTSTGTSQKDLEAWGALQLQKRLGRSSTMTVPTGFRPWILPNRVIEHRIRERLGIASAVQHTIALGGICTTTPTIAYTKKKGPDGKYRYVSGGENMPLNYSTGITKSGDMDRSGIVIRKGVQKGTSQGTTVIPPERNPNWKAPNRATKSDLALDPKLGELRPEFAAVVAEILRVLRADGWKPMIVSGYRSIEKQNALVAAGGTVARVSRHTMGIAVDLADKRFGWPRPRQVQGLINKYGSSQPSPTAPPAGTFQWPIRPTPPKPTGVRLFGSPSISKKSIHEGLDFGRKGQSVLAARAGKVRAASGINEKGRGINVIIDHDDGWQTRYYHLDSVTTTRGAQVVAGQQVGVVGATGGAIGAHLHFEVRRNGSPIDPLTVLDSATGAKVEAAQNIIGFYWAMGAAAIARNLTWGGNIKQRGFGPESNISSAWYAIGMGWDPVHIMWPISRTPKAWEIDWKGGSAPTDRGRQSAPI